MCSMQPMDPATVVARQGHRMLQIGIAHFVFSGVEGFAVPRLASPPLGLSVHTLSALQGVMFLTIGLVWPQLKLGAAGARIAYWTYSYSSLATLIPYMLAAVWGAGNTTMPLTGDHLSVIGGLTADARLLQQTQEHAFNGAGVVGFLRHLLRHLPGKLLIIWDGASIHRGQVVKEFLHTQGQRICLERLPAYAPELNPMEGIWHYLKHRELGNVYCYDQGELRTELRWAWARLRHKADVLHGYLAQRA